MSEKSIISLPAITLNICRNEMAASNSGVVKCNIVKYNALGDYLLKKRQVKTS